MDTNRTKWIRDICRCARAAGVTNKTLVRYRKCIDNGYRVLPPENQAQRDTELLGDLYGLQHMDNALRQMRQTNRG